MHFPPIGVSGENHHNDLVYERKRIDELAEFIEVICWLIWSMLRTSALECQGLGISQVRGVQGNVVYRSS